MQRPQCATGGLEMITISNTCYLKRITVLALGHGEGGAFFYKSVRVLNAFGAGQRGEGGRGQGENGFLGREMRSK